MILALLLLFAMPASAHDWMPEETKWCCNGKDCLPHSRDVVERTAEGWTIKRTGQLFRDGERGVYPNFAPDQGEVWICHMPYEPQARCIFILPEGS